MSSIARWLLSWVIVGAVVTLRHTCRVRVRHDPRPRLREQGTPYIYCVLHAHQISVLINREPGTAAMLSQSKDGQLLARAFRAMRVEAHRGSSSSKTGEAHNKGGLTALRGLATALRAGRPAIMAVDGPRGPRNHVNKGIAVLAKQTGAAVLCTVAVPHRRWIMPKVWDRFQVPQPFTLIEGYFGEPLLHQPGESIEDFRQRIEMQLNGLEMQYDADEAATAGRATARRVRRKRRNAA